MKRFFWLLILALALAACSSSDATMDESPADSQPQENTSDAAPTTVVSSQEDKQVEPTAAVVETAVLESATNTPEAVSDESTQPEPTATTDVVTQDADEPVALPMSGRYEQTFFRGLEDAPVTMLDYSDFL